MHTHSILLSSDSERVMMSTGTQWRVCLSGAAEGTTDMSEHLALIMPVVVIRFQTMPMHKNIHGQNVRRLSLFTAFPWTKHIHNYVESDIYI